MQSSKKSYCIVYVSYEIDKSLSIFAIHICIAKMIECATKSLSTQPFCSTFVKEDNGVIFYHHV